MPVSSPFQFSSKADVLQALSPYEDLNIPPLYTVKVETWQAAREKSISEIQGFFSGENALAVRSSCRREDSESSSAAGAFLSILNVDPRDSAGLGNAIDRVIASYGAASSDDQVLIQPMIRRVTVTGVIMTRVLTDGSPYYVINYDDESGRTDTITGGTSCNKTVYVYRDVQDQDFDSPRLRAFVGLARRLEELCGNDALDIEFCLDAGNILHLLQVRPICTRKNWPTEHAIPQYISHIADFISSKTGPAPDLFGQRSILGVMPDWNPAEMIGILPGPLASSLYRNLITSRVWSSARARMGYRELPATELMHLVLGRPYIDVRASFNSLLPAGLSPVTAEALVSAWLDRLEAIPQLHDKVEFDIAQTALDFCFNEHLDQRYPDLLTSTRREEFRSCLLRLTLRCLDDGPASSMNAAFDAIAELRGRQAGIPLVSAGHPLPLGHIPVLLAECRKYGTLPFSILARHAFIAESLLRTAVERGALDQQRVRDFKLSIRTISGEMSAEFREVCKGHQDAQGFMRKYGHLRPGSYDILSPRYVDREGLFTDLSSVPAPDQKDRNFVLQPEEKANLEKLLAESSLSTVTPERLLNYARRAIAGRELAKFIFSRNVSDVLEIVAQWGQGLGLSRKDMALVDIQAVLDLLGHAVPESPKEYMERHIAWNRDLISKSARLKLGYLIRSERDVFIAPQHRAAPNYIGSGKVEGPVVRLYANSSCDENLAGKIVCIENADPGFDWIFTRNIAGLVTRFGGANSHMAIRCAEYGLPAAIGVGEQLFSSVSEAASALLEPMSSTLKAQRGEVA